MAAVSDAFACLDARRRALGVKGLRLHALEWGEPAATGILLLHGGAAHAHWFDRVAPALARGRHVLALDQRGHGESAWASPPAYATEDFVADVGAVLDALGWGRAVLVGHSMGGHNALACAAWRPERVRALVIADARPAIPAERLRQLRERGARPPRRHPTVEAAVAAFRLLPPETVADPALLGHLARASVAWRDGAVMARFDPAAYAARRPIDGWALLPRIAAPTLIVRGERSPILPREMAERLRDGIRGAQLVEIPAAYHHVVLDRPAEFSGAVEAFLGRLDDPAAGPGGDPRAGDAAPAGAPRPRT
jgi:pimeloyl-ACP methyl ester carboxylesterase